MTTATEIKLGSRIMARILQRERGTEKVKQKQKQASSVSNKA